jgi:hypothetical protein
MLSLAGRYVLDASTVGMKEGSIYVSTTRYYHTAKLIYDQASVGRRDVCDAADSSSECADRCMGYWDLKSEPLQHLWVSSDLFTYGIRVEHSRAGLATLSFYWKHY